MQWHQLCHIGIVSDSAKKLKTNNKKNIKMMRTYHRYPARRFSSVLDNFFNNDFGQVFGNDHANSVAKVNVREEETAYFLEVAAPGLKKEDFQISVDKGLITIKAELKSENEENTPKYNRREFNYSSFSRSFRLSDSVDTENIAARYENGILEVSIPKREEVIRGAKEITIE